MRLRLLAVLVMGLGLFLGSMVGGVLAASSGVVYKMFQNTGSHGIAYGCFEAQANPSGGSVSNAGIIRSRTSDSCITAKSLPAGYLGVNVQGYRSGSLCGSTGYRYNSAPGSAMSTSGTLCTNPSGTQTFRTTMWGAMYTTNFGGSYSSTSLNSPNVNA